MIVEKQIITIIQNGGAIIIALTVVIGVVYTILDFPIIFGADLVMLRLVGIGLVACFAYVPYRMSQNFLLYTHYRIFFIGMWSVFFIGDIIVRFDLLISFLAAPGFVGVVIYSLIFTCVIGIVNVCEREARRCKKNNYYCYKVSIAMKNRCETILLKVKKYENHIY